MKFSKKLLALFLSAAMALSLTACGGGSASSQSGAQSGSQSSADQSQGTAAQGLKIAIVSSPNSVDDGSFNEDN